MQVLTCGDCGQAFNFDPVPGARVGYDTFKDPPAPICPPCWAKSDESNALDREEWKGLEPSNQMRKWHPDGNGGFQSRFRYLSADGEPREIKLQARKVAAGWMCIWGRKMLQTRETAEQAKSDLERLCREFRPSEPNTQDGR